MVECIPSRAKGEGWKGVHGESYTRFYRAGVQERVSRSREYKSVSLVTGVCSLIYTTEEGHTVT